MKNRLEDVLFLNMKKMRSKKELISRCIDHCKLINLLLFSNVYFFCVTGMTTSMAILLGSLTSLSIYRQRIKYCISSRQNICIILVETSQVIQQKFSVPSVIQCLTIPLFIVADEHASLYHPETIILNCKEQTWPKTLRIKLTLLCSVQ